MTSTALDPETVAWPDMEIACECELFGKPPCDRPAEWIMWRACCADKAKYLLYCTDHKDWTMSTDDYLVCRYCGRTAPAASFYTYIEPLNRRAE